MPFVLQSIVLILFNCFPLFNSIPSNAEIDIRKYSNIIYAAATDSFGHELKTKEDEHYHQLVISANGDLYGCHPSSPITTHHGRTIASFYLLSARGNCTFEDKAIAAQNIGARGVVIYNTMEGVYNNQDYANAIDYDCDSGMGYISSSSIVYPVYSDEMTNLMPASCTQSNQCVSKKCVLTNITDTILGVKVCCAWDLYISMSASSSSTSEVDFNLKSTSILTPSAVTTTATTTTPITIPVVFIRMSDADTLFQFNHDLQSNLLDIALYALPIDETVNISSFLIVLLAVFTILFAAAVVSKDELNSFYVNNDDGNADSLDSKRILTTNSDNDDNNSNNNVFIDYGSRSRRVNSDKGDNKFDIIPVVTNTNHSEATVTDVNKSSIAAVENSYSNNSSNSSSIRINNNSSDSSSGCNRNKQNVHNSKGNRMTTNAANDENNDYYYSEQHNHEKLNSADSSSSSLHTLDITAMHAILFILISSLFITLLYYLHSVVYLVTALYLCLSTYSFHQVCIAPVIHTVFRWFEGCSCQHKRMLFDNRDISNRKSVYDYHAIATSGNNQSSELNDSHNNLTKIMSTFELALTIMITISFTLLWCILKSSTTLEYHYLWIWVSVQNLWGVCSCILFLRTVRLPNLQVATILLSLAFIYDIFFVFYSSTVFGSDIMSAVVMSSTVSSSSSSSSSAYFSDENYCEKYPLSNECDTAPSLPMLFIFPTLNIDINTLFTSFSSSSVSSSSASTTYTMTDNDSVTKYYTLLGLGDVILPGLLLVYTARLDLRRSGVIQFPLSVTLITHQQPFSWLSCLFCYWCGGGGGDANGAVKNNIYRMNDGYFPMALILYICALLLTNYAVNRFQTGQPALLYILPLLLLPILLRSWCNGLLYPLLWHTLPELKAVAFPITATMTEEQESLLGHHHSNAAAAVAVNSRTRARVRWSQNNNNNNNNNNQTLVYQCEYDDNYDDYHDNGNSSDHDEDETKLSSNNLIFAEVTPLINHHHKKIEVNKIKNINTSKEEERKCYDLL